MNDKNNSEPDNQRILDAWRELKDAIQSAPVADLREIIAKDQGLNLTKTKTELDCAIGQLATLIRNGDSRALQVLHAGCCRMSKAVDYAIVQELGPSNSTPGQALDFQKVWIDFEDAIDDLIDLARLGEPGALEVLLCKGARSADLLTDSDARVPDKTTASLPVPGQDGDPSEPDWRLRMDHAIDTLAKEPFSKLAEAFGKVAPRLREPRFVIKKLSSSLPQIDPDGPDSDLLYTLCDHLVEKRLNPRKAPTLSIREFLEGSWNSPASLESQSAAPPLKNPGRARGTPGDFAFRIYERIEAMRARPYPCVRLEEFENARNSQASNSILKQLRNAKAEEDRRGMVWAGEEWINCRTPNAILEQLVALLPPFGSATIDVWLDASIAFVFVRCEGDFEKCTWPASVMLSLEKTEGLPSAIRKTLRKGLESLASANTL